MKTQRNQRDREMAAHLKASGYPHGRRYTTTCAPCIPSMADVGSAAYRRRTAKAQGRQAGAA